MNERCELTGVILLPDGHVDAKNVEQLMQCPWFWSISKQCWLNRPEFLVDHESWKRDPDFQ